jgi:hypothetical protein
MDKKQQTMSEIKFKPQQNNQTEAKSILMQLGEAARKTALAGADILSNLSGEIKQGLRN